MPAMASKSKWAHCRYCGAHKSVRPLSRNGACYDCALSRATAYVRSVHPGGVAHDPPSEHATSDDQGALDLTG